MGLNKDRASAVGSHLAQVSVPVPAGGGGRSSFATRLDPWFVSCWHTNRCSDPKESRHLVTLHVKNHRRLGDPCPIQSGLCCRWRPHLQRLACTSAWRSGWQQPGQQPTTPTGRASIYCAAVTSGTGQRHAVARLAWNLRAGSGNSKCPHQAVGRHLIARIRRISLFAILPKRESWRKRDVLTTSMT